MIGEMRNEKEVRGERKEKGSARRGEEGGGQIERPIQGLMMCPIVPSQTLILSILNAEPRV